MKSSIEVVTFCPWFSILQLQAMKYFHSIYVKIKGRKFYINNNKKLSKRENARHKECK